MVYARDVGNRTVTLAVSGMLWNRSLVMIDEETGSLWPHLLGRAMQGPLQGAELQPIPAEMVTWEAWRREHPQTTVLNLSKTSGSYVKQFYKKPQDFVFGWIDRGQAYAARFDVLIEHPVLNVKQSGSPLVVTFDKQSTAAHLFSSQAGDRSLEFEWTADDRMADTQTKTLWNSNTGLAVEGPLKGTRLKQLVGIMSFTRTWNVFHPDSRPIRPPTPRPPANRNR